MSASFTTVFASLIEQARWINWTLDASVRSASGKPAKRPVDVRGTGTWSSALDPSTWMTYAEACAQKYPIAYVLGDKKHFCLDLDNCGDTHAWISRFPGAALERSFSGTGYHVWGCAGNLGSLRHGTRCRQFGAELYTSRRFIAMGTPIAGSSATDCTAPLNNLVLEYFPPSADVDGAWTEEADPTSTAPVDDDALIQKALNARLTAEQAFGGKASFRALFEGDEDTLGGVFPSPHDAYDRSGADLALAAALAFWTGRNCERVLRIMRRSALVRDKWDRFDDYLKPTILKAVASCRKIYDYVEPPSPQVVTHDEADMQFEDFVYVHHGDLIVHRKTGVRYTQSQFNNFFGAKRFAIPGEKNLCKPWDAFIRNPQGYARAHDLCFDPLQEPGALVVEGHLTYLNTWRGLPTVWRPGVPQLLLDHIYAMYPPQDANVLIAALAGYVQHLGHKCPWMPVQYGPEGNGKSTITDSLIRVFGDQPLTVTLRARQIGGRFNANIEGRVLAVIDDVDRLSGESLEALKSMITSTRIEVERKGTDPRMIRTCCNYIANTNVVSSIPKTHNDRRIAMLRSIQQTKEDVESAFSTAYFHRLHDWLAAPEHIEVVHGWLRSYRIPDELDFRKGAIRAPETTGASEAIAHSYPEYVQFIHEAIEEGAKGFRDGWVSMYHIRRLYKQLGAHLPSPKTLEAAVKILGYERMGRATRALKTDQGRPSIYRHRSAPKVESNWLAAYEDAQTEGSVSHTPFDD